MDVMPEIMDGKNVADFIDADIVEKLEALEREEEKLQADGFYDSEEDIVSVFLWCPSSLSVDWSYQFDSDDEREAAEAKVGLTHKIKSQSIKKSRKNQSRLPRTAVLRTLNELTTGLTNAGLDPSRIRERAEKLQDAERKRKRDVQMDVDMDEGVEGGEDEWMDVDGDDGTPNKRVKGNSGAVVPVNSKAPRTNRQMAGMRDDTVRIFTAFWVVIRLKRHPFLSASIEGYQNAQPWTEASQYAC